MTDVVSPAFVKKTQEKLGKFVKKPQLTEKLLKKPPFRFLHDIVNVVVKETGFLSDVLSAAELNYETITNKESKIAFLQKVIDAVSKCTI